ncbi:hormogonium polysaccharide biosynthesis glycosyltransferase HpsE [Cyanobacterium sp. IPPAS B-1200]|uniref:hormogonium polysaccharide biosynthesis glycosyltransferase HpsE n=1 Tax=Cyanobacterium sp. IPPAS B-1200 TaxID=1562720 RepID=UPI000852654C|nr:hormogonium polysaccharide biosynthesis glycosyltransferase HpsE [Cyanobacterium sp. IPPAS B-1200]OEJ79331.1 glycosyl transferase [Cyanobacterium sp. IPPAS B-1200]
MIDFTVAICTYNGEKRVPDVLDRLKQQIDTEDINWEIIVIDNNSNDNTAKVIEEYKNNWNVACPIKCYFEEKQGLAYARQKAVEEANGNLIGFLDDDNLPTSNWVEQAYLFGKQHPKAGAYGSKIKGEYEIEPPPNFEKISRFFAIGGSDKTICYTSDDYQYAYKRVLPPGAGIVVHKQAWLDNVPTNLFLQGRVSGLQLPGDDLEAFLHLRKAGWEIWYNPAMEIYHKIPKERLQKDYIVNLMKGNGLSRYYTRMLGWKVWQRPFILPIYAINDLRKIMIHFFKHRKLLETDIVLKAEMKFLVSSFVSPLYFWKYQIFRR